jgi:hypothetical protein
MKIIREFVFFEFVERFFEPQWLKGEEGKVKLSIRL